MYLFHRINTNWLPRVSLFLILLTILSNYRYVPGSNFYLGILPAVFLIVIFYGLSTVLKDSGVNFSEFYRRPANIATLVRSLLVLAGLVCGALWLTGGFSLYKWFSLIFISLGYGADFLDGWLARREKVKPPAAEWGAWYDAETDALLLLISGIFITYFTEITPLLLLPGLFRYIFGLLFWFFPSDYDPPVWYFWYSKTIAAIFETVMAVLWCTILLKESSGFMKAFLTIQIRVFIPLITLLILSSFIVESHYRAASLLNRVPAGFRWGIFRSFIIYYRIPFRYGKMKKFYSRLINSRDLVFDVGAHLGNRTRTFLDLGAYVVSFEPQPACIGLLDLWFGSHENAQQSYCALGANKGNVEMLLSSRNPTLASTDSKWVSEMLSHPEFQGIEWDGRCRTEVHTLDEMIDKFGMPKFIKIDTEGNEGKVLKGLSSAVALISYEFLPSQKNRAKECITRLSRLGKYFFNYSIGESMKMALKDALSAEEMTALIDSYPQEGKSGDIYAFLQ